MNELRLPSLVFENKGLAIEASAKLLGRVLDKLHGFRGFLSPSDTNLIMDEGAELTYSSQNPTINNVKVSYFLRELPWVGLENRVNYSGLITIKNQNEILERDLLAIHEDFKRDYDVIDGIARLKEKWIKW